MREERGEKDRKIKRDKERRESEKQRREREKCAVNNNVILYISTGRQVLFMT